MITVREDELLMLIKCKVKVVNKKPKRIRAFEEQISFSVLGIYNTYGEYVKAKEKIQLKKGERISMLKVKKDGSHIDLMGTETEATICKFVTDPFKYKLEIMDDDDV